MELGDLEGAARDLAEAETRRPGDAEAEAARKRLAALEQQSRSAGVAAAPPPGEPAPTATVVRPVAGEAGSAAASGVEPAGSGSAASGATVAAPEPATGASLETPAVARAAATEPGGGLWRIRADVNVRAGPGNDHPVVRVARRGLTLQVLGTTRGWKEVMFEDGVKGFVYERWLEPVAETGERG